MKQQRRQIDHRIAWHGPIIDWGLDIFPGRVRKMKSMGAFVYVVRLRRNILRQAQVFGSFRAKILKKKKGQMYIK